MANEILPYIEMCQREGVSLQRGMNYELGGNHSVILMSVRPGAPYADRFEDDGSTLVYEGHDIPRSSKHADPKSFNQPEYSPSGNLTENGKFHRATQEFKTGRRPPERGRVYEKIKQGIWFYNGVFDWLIPGKSKATVAAFSSSNLQQLKVKKTSLFLFRPILKLGA